MKLLNWKKEVFAVIWAIKNCNKQMDYGMICQLWALSAVFTFFHIQTNEYWIVYRQIVNSSSSVLSNPTCVSVTWSCYAVYFVLRFVVVVAISIAVELCNIFHLQFRCIETNCSFFLLSSPCRTTQWPFSHMNFQFNIVVFIEARAIARHVCTFIIM